MFCKIYLHLGVLINAIWKKCDKINHIFLLDHRYMVVRDSYDIMVYKLLIKSSGTFTLKVLNGYFKNINM